MRGLPLIAVVLCLLPLSVGCQPDECCAQEIYLEGYFTPATPPEDAPAGTSQPAPSQSATTTLSPACASNYCSPRYEREMHLKRYYGTPLGPIRRLLGRVFRGR